MIKYRRELHKIIDLSLPAAELGCAEGYFSADILSWGVKKLYMVDAWRQLDQKGDGGFEQEWHDKNFEQAQERVKKYGNRVEILRGLTHEMALKVKDNSLGLVYVDADHTYKGVTMDNKAWWGKLVKGGVMAFHDYNNRDYGVTEAVRDFFVPLGIKINILPEDTAADTGAYVIKN